MADPLGVPMSSCSRSGVDKETRQGLREVDSGDVFTTAGSGLCFAGL